MHSLQAIFIYGMLLMICVGVSNQSAIELIKNDELASQNDTSSTLDNLSEINQTNHRKGRCKSKCIICVFVYRTTFIASNYYSEKKNDILVFIFRAKQYIDVRFFTFA